MTVHGSRNDLFSALDQVSPLIIAVQHVRGRFTLRRRRGRGILFTAKTSGRRWTGNGERMEEGEGNKCPPENQEKKPREGGGGWGFSSFSIFSNLQKAAEDISVNAVEAIKNAGITDLQSMDSDAAQGQERKGGEDESENNKLRKSALDRLEKASEDSLFGQGLKVLDNSVETFAFGAWSALGNAWKGGSRLVSRLEHSAANLADSIQHGDLPGSPSIIETGKTFTTKGMEVLERVGKETMDLLIVETGLEVEKDPVNQQADEEEFEEVTFDRCFYIYGGPDLLEELEALSSHHVLLFNRRKTKLLAEQKSLYNAKLLQVQQFFSLGTIVEENGVDPDIKNVIETTAGDSDTEMKRLCESSVKKAADIAAGFTSSLGGLTEKDIIQRATDGLETIHSECIHRLSELCCSAISQLLALGKSVISSANKAKNEEINSDSLKIDWPGDSALKAKVIRYKAQSMIGDMETISNSFITGISDIIEAHLTVIQGVSSDKQVGLPHTSVQEKANVITNHFRAGQTSAAEKIQDALHYLTYVMTGSSMAFITYSDRG
ncbi:hypothetical protein MUK42_25860 [Musa troglodytarum]|uniref:DUF7798 domain-containing protein n=1 Tax=Musa troglodytarum TaxID=320322 RepID=A0A9E7J9W6_9LILI|nr:hypothetical protein MUK42_25860 [Musa troglodytarum]